MKTIHERLLAITTVELFKIARKYSINEAYTYSELINKIESEIYLGNIAVDDINI